MRRTRVLGVILVTGLIVSLLIGGPVAMLLSADGPVGSVSAQEADDDEGEEGIEELIEETIEDYGLAGALVVLLAGAILLIFFVEKLISYLSRAAIGLGVSVFSLAILFTGFEFDDTVLALVFAGGGMEEVALGTALGTALAIVGITLAVAAFVHPFAVTIPRDYLGLLVVSPLVLVPLVLLGTLSAVHGIVLIGLFFVFVAYILMMERRRDSPVFRDSELIGTDTSNSVDGAVDSDSGLTPEERLKPIAEDRFVGRLSYASYAWLGLAIIALAGVVAGSILIETGSEVILEETGVEETIFGATVITLLLTFENILLTLEPVRRGIPEIGIGHVIGSVVFSVTANIGFILLLADLSIGSTVLFFHLPALLVMTTLGAYFILTGRLRRRHGIILGALYIAYWIIAVLGFGGVPISG